MILLLRYVAWLFYPLSICLELLLLGLLLLWLGKRQTVGKVLVTLGTALLLLFSWGPFSRLLLGSLESTYPPLLNPDSVEQSKEEPVRWVVVLGAGYNPDLDVPATARPTSASLIRLAEGVRIYRKLPGSKLIVLVGEDNEERVRERTVQELAEAWSVPSSDLVIEAGARDTAEEATAVARRAHKGRFVLVSSVCHLPRAMRLFHDRGLQPVPAPTDYPDLKREHPGLEDLPSPRNLGLSQEGIYERLASAWRALGG